ncbi:Indole-3-glycerol phosphate synthase (EC [Olavius algarvensis Delta 1 endosymbiont]|nr:Indole-3-glycerol phosphate synthase (EC [Olavius algarvensis Delta 1 endosymbiont]
MGIHQRLTEILAEKKNEVARLKKSMPDEIDGSLPPIRDFKAAISAPGRINLIAEIKFASPSAGRIRPQTEPESIGKIYEDSGAAAISLLTDKRFFQGDLNYLPRLKKTVALPILRKDFIIDAVQVREAALFGADSFLLIARILSQTQLAELISVGRERGMIPLTEIHDRDDLEKALDAGADVIGINNRDLDSFTVDINTTYELAPLVPDDRVVVSESGLAAVADIRSLINTGIQAVLVGSALMRSDDLAKKTTEIVRAGILAEKPIEIA